MSARGVAPEPAPSSRDRNATAVSGRGATGTEHPMQIMEPHTIRTTDSGDPDIVVVVETDEHEHVEFHGASRDEITAKLDDFRTWAT